MNQKQREFLIATVNKKMRAAKDAIDASIPKKPQIKDIIVTQIMSGTAKVKSAEKILLNAKKGIVNGRFTFESSWRGDTTKVSCGIDDIFIIDDQMQKLLDDWNEIDREAGRKKKEIDLATESLIVRIQLATDKTLDPIIQDIDNMGELRLADASISKFLTQ